MPATAHPPLPDSDFALVRRFPLVRIRTDADLAAALAVMDDLLTQELDAGGEAYLDVLSSLARAYETEHHPVPDATAAEVLRELIGANGLTATAVASRAGLAPATVSALLAGRRPPTPEQAAALAAVFRVRPTAFRPAAG